MLLLKLKSWLRNWLSLDHVPPQIGGGILHPANISDGAASLVERSRAGDQNAKALIAEIGVRAREGVPRAKKAYGLIEEYIQKHPYKDTKAGFGAEIEVDQLCEDVAVGFCGEEISYVDIVTKKVPEIAAISLNKAAVTLANGPSLLVRDGSTLLQDVSGSMQESDRKAFMVGYHHGVQELNSVPPNMRVPFLLGHILGTARRIQAVRCPGIPISVLSPQAGMELGE